jgi:hypothetical protein
MILEYKLDRTEQGYLKTPDWVQVGGYMHNPDDHTLVGFVPVNRPWKVPDSVTTLTVQQAKDRFLAVHAIYPQKNLDGSTMTTQEVEDMVQAIIDGNDIA